MINNLTIGQSVVIAAKDINELTKELNEIRNKYANIPFSQWPKGEYKRMQSIKNRIFKLRTGEKPDRSS